MTEPDDAAPQPISRLGTPMSGNATKVLLLGSGEIGRELTISFQRLGLEVHAVDRYPNAPAHQVAQFAHVADVRDSEQVLGLVQRLRPDYVVPEIEAVASDALAEVEARGSAEVIPVADACGLTGGRQAIRTKAHQELGLPTTAYRFATDREEFAAAFEELGYPCVVKPESATSGRGHSTVHGPEDVDDAWRHAQRVPAPGPVTVERFVDFDYEVTIIAVRSIDPATGELATWFCEPIGHRHESGDLVECWQPMQMSQRAMDNARSVAARITNALGGRGVFGVELFVAGDDVYFSSVTPRPHDTGFVTLQSQRFSQFDLHARAILGLPIDVTLTTPGASVVLHADAASRTVSYTGLADALAVSETDVTVFAKPTTYEGRRMGLAISTGETVEDARQRAAEAAAKLVVETR